LGKGSYEIFEDKRSPVRQQGRRKEKQNFYALELSKNMEKDGRKRENGNKMT
jgi:hypothetical protein